MVNAGVEYRELRGVELSGAVVPAGDVPCTAARGRALVSPEQLFDRKYSGGEFVPDGRQAWLRLAAESAYISVVAKL